MKKLWLLILCPSVLLTALAAHAEVPGKAIDQKIEACSKKAVSTLDSEACLQQGYTDWDKELNVQYQALLKGQPAAVKKAIVQSQRDWLTYQKSYFNALDNFYRQQQGTVWGIVDEQAKLDFICHKAIELNSFAGSLELSNGQG
ncbi:lysozyme inhibitor LprI family protein [Rouxiella badensis]|uniref:lysozyme inhibitor LprI family protein n=1 Tax=Rouxiella badensis TaxID=1646377 RepID=UPI0028D3AA3D|nr:lysozyme inhibitor LprI family protein [Rouxiella badensis]